MASGTIALTRTGSGYLTGQIAWSSTSNGTQANTSTVTARLQIQRSALNATTGTFKGTFTVGRVSESISWYGTLPSYEWVTIKTITATVGHNANGNGSCYLYAIVNGPTQTTMEGTYVSGSSTVTLDRILRHASISAVKDFTDEENPAIMYSNPAGTAVEVLQACISLTKEKDDISYRNIPKTGTGYTFSLTDAERNLLRAATPNRNLLTVYVFIRSTIGGSTVRTYKPVTMRIVNAQPVLSSSVVDTNEFTVSLTGSASTLVAQHSIAQVSVNARAQKYATIVSKKVEHGAASLTGDGTFSPVTNKPIRFTVTDSRGNTTTQYAANKIIPYFNPTCTIGNNLPSADGTFSLVVSGMFYGGEFGQTLTVQYRYKAAIGNYSDWMSIADVTKNGNHYTATENLTGLNYQTVYTFQARVIDPLNPGGIYAAKKSVIAEPVFDWGQSDFQFNVPVNLKDGCNILKNGEIAYVPTATRMPTDLNTELLNGYFRTTSAVDNSPFTHGAGHIRSYNESEAVQSIVQTTSGTEVVRYTADGGVTWVAEYRNPPMTVGNEYRTSKRWQGKPVYVKLLNIGTMPNAASSTFTAYGLSAEHVISVHGTTDNGRAFPYTTTNETFGRVSLFVNAPTSAGNVGIRIESTSDMSAHTGYVLLEYTKTTD